MAKFNTPSNVGGFRPTYVGDEDIEEAVVVSQLDDTASVSETADPEAIEALLEAAEAIKKKLEDEKRQIKEDLAKSIEDRYRDRSNNRQSKELEWIESLRLMLPSGATGVHSYSNPDRPFDQKEGAIRPKINLVSIKVSVAVAQGIAAQFAGGDKNWDIVPETDFGWTPEQSDGEVERADRMEWEIDRQLTNARYGPKMRDGMWNRCALGTAVIKGPINTSKVKRKYVQQEDGSFIPEMTQEYCMGIENVDPWFFFPDDTVTCIQDAQDCIELHPTSALTLQEWMKHPGFDSEAIRRVLKEQPKEYKYENFAIYSKLSGSNVDLFKNKYKVLEYHGPVQLTELNTLELEPSYESPIGEYFAEVWVCDGEIIRAKLSPLEGYFQVPYNVCVWEKDPTSIFGYGLPYLLKDHQQVLTQTWHMALDNASLTSGPQVILQKGLVEPANGQWVFNPRKVWLHKDPMTPVSNSMHFFTPPNTVGDLNNIIEIVLREAEKESGVPMMSAGLDSPQVGTSATGAAMLQQNSSLLGDFKSEAWDDNITDPIIQGAYDWIMQYGEDNTVKGNFRIDVRSSTDTKNNLMQIQNMEKVSLEASQDPDLALVVNKRKMTMARLAAMGIPATMINSVDEVRRLEEERANQGPPPELQIKMKELEIKERELALKEQELQFQLQQQQQREAWEYEERMAATMARIAEAEAAAVRTQNEKETALINMAAKQEVELSKLQQTYGIAVMNDSTKKFLEGQKAVQKDKELISRQQEMKLKQKFGTGI